MSSISALKVVYRSKKKGSRAILIVLLSFVFCFSSLKICVKAENTSSEAQDIAYSFFFQMGFRIKQGTNLGIDSMANDITGGTIGQRSPDVNPQVDMIYIIYYDFMGGDSIRITNTNCQLNVGLAGTDNLYIARITGTGSTKVYFNSAANVIPIYVGYKNAMPPDIYSIATDQTINDLLIDINSDTENILTAVNHLDSMSVSQYQRLGTIATNTGNISTKLSTTNSKLDDIKSYFQSNNQTTNDNVTNNNTQKANFDTKANNLATFESTQGTNLDTNLQSLNISSSTGLLVNSSFVKSALWVNSMFDRLIVGSPFELVLVFCLSLGIAFAMIGKVK